MLPGFSEGFPECCCGFAIHMDSFPDSSVLRNPNAGVRDLTSHDDGSNVPTVSKETLKTRRALAGFTQVELAVKAGVSPATVHRIESGRTSPSRLVVEALERALGESGSHNPQDTPLAPVRGKRAAA